MAPTSKTSRTTTARRAAVGAATAKTSARKGVRERAAAVVESSGVESVLDRILVKRLRPLRDDVVAARKSFEEQVTLRAQAESRAERAEERLQQAETRLALAADETAGLRARVAQLQSEVAELQQRRGGWLRRRRLEQQPQS